jgi:hypothetical protein
MKVVAIKKIWNLLKTEMLLSNAALSVMKQVDAKIPFR